MSDTAAEQPAFRDRPVSFVRRSGRMSDAQERAWAELAPRFVLTVERDAAATSVLPGTAIDPAAVWGRDAPLVVEIGSGQGHAIVHAAASAPERDFLAIEVFRAGLARTMLDAERAGLQNLRLVEANAPEVLQHLLPAASVSELWVFFPDPWHKNKHTKRRLVVPEFAAIAAGALRDGGIAAARDGLGGLRAADARRARRSVRVRARVRGGVGGALRRPRAHGVRAQGRARRPVDPRPLVPAAGAGVTEPADPHAAGHDGPDEQRATGGSPSARDRWRFVRPLAHRDFRMLFASVVLSVFGAGMWAVVMVYTVIGGGGGPVDLSIVAAANAVGLLACAIPGGIVADRVSRRLILRVVELVNLVALISVAVAGLVRTRADPAPRRSWRSSSVPAPASSTPPTARSCPASCRPRSCSRRTGSKGAIRPALQQAAGPAVAGVVVAAVVAPAHAVWVIAAAHAVALVLLLFVRPEPETDALSDHEASATTRGVFHDLREAVAFTVRTPWLLWTLLYATVWVLVWMGPQEVLAALRDRGAHRRGPALVRVPPRGVRRGRRPGLDRRVVLAASSPLSHAR